MNDVVTEYVQRHRRCIFAIIGLPIEESNHHIFAEALYHEVRRRLSDVEMQYHQITTDDDLKRLHLPQQGFTIISSNVVLRTTVKADFTVFIDTPDSVLIERSGSSRSPEWEGIKANVSGFVNDYTRFKIDKVSNVFKRSRPSKTFFALWKLMIRLILEKLRREDSRT